MGYRQVDANSYSFQGVKVVDFAIVVATFHIVS